MSSIRPEQLRAAAYRAARLPKDLLEERELTYLPSRARPPRAETLVNRTAFLAGGGSRPSPTELERILGSNDLVDEFFFERALLAATPICRILIRSPSHHVRGHATGFMVSPRLLMTNEHVFGTPDEAAPSLAEFNYRLDVAGNPESSYCFRLRPDQFFFNDLELDFALVSVEPIAVDGVTALSGFGFHRLIAESGKSVKGEWMTIIQHPGGARRQWAIRENQCIEDKDPDVVWYMSDTARGSSGAPVLNDSFQVVALHHSGVARKEADGKYVLKTGQRVADLRDVDDSQVDWIANAGIRVSRICACIDAKAPDRHGHLAELKSAREGGDVLSDAYQALKEGSRMNQKVRSGEAQNAGRLILGTLVLELNPGLQLGRAGAAVLNRDEAAVVAADDGNASAVEGLKEPIVDTNYSTRMGFQTDFLGVDTPLPTVTKKDLMAPMKSGGTVIPYEHFSVVLHRDRKLAIFTASNVDGSSPAKRPEPGKKYTRKALTGLGDSDMEKWVLDPRVDTKYQIADKFYTKDQGAFDKGHVVRREDVCWGASFAQIQRANGDTFHVTNCSPQRGHFNQSSKQGIWGQLENYIGAQSDAERYCIFAGPVLAKDDETFPGTERVQIPSRFWKVICAVSSGRLQVFAFVLEQDLTDLPLEFQVDAEWKPHQITLRELQQLIGIIKFPKLYHDADQGL